MRVLLVLMGISFVPHFACACAVPGVAHKNQGSWQAYFNEHKKIDKASRKPADVGLLPYSKLEPWGGEDRGKWKPEAIMANAASEALNDGFNEANVKDVLVSMPVIMRHSGNEKRVYGDGQTNAAVDLGSGWSEREPVLIATLITYNDGSQKLKFRFHQKLALAGKGAKLVYNGKTKLLEAGTRSQEGHIDFEWKPSKTEAPQWGDLFANQIAFIQPTGWDDWFPVDFRDVARPASELLAQLPKEKQKLGKGTAIDPENVSVQGREDNSFPFLAMKDASFGSAQRAERYFPVPASGEPQGIHNNLADGRVTAVGRGFSTVYQTPPSSDAPFKMAYICFDKRNRSSESTYGVPSGGGWHEIGDEAETVFNNLERAPIVFGYANGKPAAKTPSGKFAYDLTDVAVIRKLMPGYAIISAAGPTTYGEDTADGKCLNSPNRGMGGPEGRNYHWFIFDHPHTVCAFEWVHPNIPTPKNKLGFEPMTRAGCK